MGGNVAAGSVLDVMLTVWLTVLARFQLSSTALTMRLKLAAAFWGSGVPVLPVKVPGAAVSPGSNN